MTDSASPRPTTPHRDGPTWALLAASIAALLVNGAIAVWNTRAMDESQAWVAHTHAVLENAQRLLSALQDAEARQREFLMMGTPTHLEPYESSVSGIHEELGRLDELTRDNPAQQQRLAEIRPLIERRLEMLRRAVELRQQSGLEAAQAAVVRGEGEAAAEDLRARLGEFTDVERRLIGERARRFRANAAGAVLGEVLGALVSVALVAWAFRLLVSRRRERERAAELFAGEGERLRTTLTSIGDGVIVTDDVGRVTLLNKVAEDLTGWNQDEAIGQPLSQVFHIINEETREQVVSPVDRVLREGVVVGLANHTTLVAKDGTERPIADSGAPVRDLQGVITGVVLVFRDQTEERRTEVERARLAAIVESTDDAILSKDLTGTILTWNAAATSLLGHRPEEAVGQPVDRIIPPERLEEEAAIVARIKAGERVAHFETRRVAKNGAVLDVSITVSPLRDGYGRIVGASKIMRDITDRKRAEDAQRESEERFRTMADAIPQLAWIANSDGYIHWYNQRWYEYTGTRPEQMEGWGWQSVHDPEALPNVLARWKASIASGEPFDMVFPLRGANGRFRPFLTRVLPLKDSRGGVVQWFGTNTDITERIETEDALRRSRLGLSRLAEASLRVVRETDLKGMLQAVSEAAIALTDARNATCGHGDVAGRSMVGGSARAPGASGCPPGEMFVLERGGVHMELVDSAEAIRLTDAQLRSHPRWWGGPAGHLPLRGLLGARMVGRNGRTNGMILVTDKVNGDFTEEDESLLRQLATIASLALQHVEARIAMEEADRAKNQFLAMLSHELRNPLAPIRNSLYILGRTAVGGEQARRAEAVIQRQVDHLTRIVDDLLDMTRISRGKIQLQRERVDLDDLIRRTVDDYRSLFDQNGLQVHVELPGSPLWINADRTRLVQVVGNLLQNSAKFTESGGRVSLSLTSNDDLQQAVLRVRDTGVGIGSDMLARVFEPFAQADTTLARSKGGLGLGLALVKALVEMHGGHVTVWSDGLGKGAEFVTRLPLDGAATQPPSTVRSSGVRSRRILVIEDNVDAANSLREVLELDGHSVAVAFSGAEGVSAARAYRPEVILCDIGLPGTDGYEIAQAIKADPALRGTWLVALTGYAAPEDVARSRAAGFDAHVAKPPDPEELRVTLAPK